MAQFYPLIIDVVAVFITLLVIFKAYRMGFLRSMVLLIGYVLSILAALYLSRLGAEYIFDTFIRSGMIDSINSTITTYADVSSIVAALPLVLDMLPKFLVNAALANFGGEEGVIAILNDKITDLGVGITDFVVGPIINSMLQVLLCVVIFIICVIIVKTIAKIFKGLYAIPILGAINSILGGLLGIVQAGVFLVLAGLVSTAVVSISANSIAWFNDSVLRSTIVFKYFYLWFV